MPPSVELVTQRDFTGGLNLRADQFQLGPNESPELLNMDVDPRGGVRLRPGVSAYAPALPYTAGWVGEFRSSAGDKLYVTEASGGLVHTGDGSAAWVQAVNVGSTPWRAVQFKDALYLQNGSSAPRKRSAGGVTSSMTQSYANDFAAPGSGNMPIASAAAVHHGHMFVADTLESGTAYPARVRFSHPNQAEAWRADDWFDLDAGINNESIEALVPYTDHLLAFKANSVYAVFGFSWENWQQQAVSREVGLVNANAAAATPQGVYFFDWPNGVMLWTGRGLEWVFSRLVPAIQDGSIPEPRRGEISVSWAGNRLWVSVPWNDGGSRLLVMDPSLGKEGSWVMYDVPVTNVLEFSTASGSQLVAAHRDSAQLIVLDQFDQPYDDYGSGATHIDSVYRTRWFDANTDAMRKRFRRIHHTFWGDGAGEIYTDLYIDYDGANRRKSWTETVLSQTESEVWDDPAPLLWDDDWVWGAEGTHHAIERGTSLGNAHSVQMRYRGPNTDTAWGIDSITVPYQRRRVK
jgi:hypothetical protein